jgi:hypothetical protein
MNGKYLVTWKALRLWDLDQTNSIPLSNLQYHHKSSLFYLGSKHPHLRIPTLLSASYDDEMRETAIISIKPIGVRAVAPLVLVP